MSNHSKSKVYSSHEELAHGISHAIGAGFAVTGLVILLITATRYGNVYHIVSAAIYGSSLILLYFRESFIIFFLSRAKKFFQELTTQ